MNWFFEQLETRALLSGSPINLTIAADRLAVREDLLQFKLDCVKADATLLTDCSALKAADLKQDTTLAPLFKQLHRDVAAMHGQLLSDNLNEDAAVLKDQSAIVTELVKMLADKSNPTALKMDHTALLADRVQLQTDEIAGLNSRLATREADLSTLSTDMTSISTALAGDTGASTALTTAVNKFVSDRTTILTTLPTDLGNIITARTKLAGDLTAEESQS